MRVRRSYVDNVTWPVSRQLHDALTEAVTCARHLGGNPSMTRTADSHVRPLLVRGAGTVLRAMEFHRFILSWVVDGSPVPL